jgi:hypothetical protein
LTPVGSGGVLGGVAKLQRGLLPKDLLLDLIAITRLLWAKEQASGGHPIKLQEIADVGKSLRVALDLAVKCEPDTMGHRAAWDRADNAVEALGALLKDEQALPLLQTVSRRMLKIRQG